MLKVLLARFRQGHRTAPAPTVSPSLSDRFRGLPVLRPELCREGCRACAWRYACGGGCPVMNLARLRGAESRPRVVEYSRRITCDLSRALLADSLWGLADQARDAGPAPGERQARNGALSVCRT